MKGAGGSGAEGGVAGKGAGTGGATGATGGKMGGGGGKMGGGGKGAVGGGSGAGVGGMPFGGMAGAGLAGFPQGGMTSEPFAHCMVPPLQLGTTCTEEQACEALECGKPWALQGADGCLRQTCTSASDCAAGERCVPAPVAGEFGSFLTAGCESCEIINGKCACTCLEGASVRAVCLAEEELSPANDCPLAGLTCAHLSGARGVVVDYLSEEAFGADVLALLESCRVKLVERYGEECTAGQGGAGGEGGGG